MSLFRKRFGGKATTPQRDAGRAPQPVPPPPPPPEFLRDNDVRTSLGPDAVITGRLSFTTPTRIEGTLKGELRCTQLLIVGETAMVEGLIKADELRIEGTIRGEIVEARRVEITPSGRFYGRMRTDALMMHDKAIFEGDCRMSPEEKPTRTRARG